MVRVSDLYSTMSILEIVMSLLPCLWRRQGSHEQSASGIWRTWDISMIQAE
jgi:hypothetical protein